LHANLQLILVGLGSGAAYAVLAVGLVLIYRGSGVLNFAHGAIASFGAYSFLWLAGDHGVPKLAAAVIAVVVAVVVGSLFEFVVMRRLSNAPALARVVATLGLLVGLIAAIPLLFSDKTRRPIGLFPTGKFTLPIGSPKFFIPADRFWLGATACALTLIVWAALRYTVFGKATRAVAENQRAVSSLGHSAQNLALANWAIGSLLAGVAGVLLAGLVVQSETMLTEIMIAGLAAALVAGFRSFGVTLAAAFGLSALQTLLIRYSSNLTNTTTIVGWGDLAPFLVIVVYMTARGAAIPLRGALLETRLPAVPAIRRPLVKVSVAFVIVTGLYLVASNTMADAMTVTLIGGLVCLSLVVLVGFVGQVSLIQMALAGVGAFAASKAAISWGLPFPLPIVVGGLFAILVGMIAAVPALRVRGINLAVITISAAFAFDAAFFTDVRLARGGRFHPASLFGWHISGVRQPKGFGIVVLVIVLLVVLGIAYLRQSPVGVRFLAVRANERGAAALGVSLARTKLLGFAIAAFIAGAAGGLYGYRAETLSFGTFGAFQSLIIVTFTYLGGIGAILGAFIGAANLSGAVIPHILHFQGTASRVLQVVGGAGVMFTVVRHPDGVVYLIRDLRGDRRRRGEPETPADADDDGGAVVDPAAPIELATATGHPEGQP
jgi:ABC-type branched-subunit amino acid transport system permease subunit